MTYYQGYTSVIKSPEYLRAAAARVLSTMRKDYPGTNVIAVRGTSGGFVAAAMMMLDPTIRVLYVRKQGEEAHGTTVEGMGENRKAMIDGKYVIVDDLVSTGNTIARIYEAVGKNCAGVVLYESSPYFSPAHLIHDEVNHLKYVCFSIKDELEAAEARAKMSATGAAEPPPEEIKIAQKKLNQLNFYKRMARYATR